MSNTSIDNKNSLNEDDFLFEIDDTAYLTTHFGFFSLAFLLLVFIGFLTEGWTRGDHRALFATGAGIALQGMMSINLILYFWKKDKKIRFYKSYMLRTNGKVKINLDDIREAYILKLNMSCSSLPKRKPFGFLGFISMILIGPFLFIPVLIGIFFISLFKGRIAPYMNTLLLIDKDTLTAVSFPLNVISKYEYEQINTYLMDYLGVGIKDFKRGLIHIPYKAIANLPQATESDLI